MRLACLALALAACDPVWHVDTTLRDPGNRAVENATVAVACVDGRQWGALSARSDRDGHVIIEGMGDRFPVGCDVFVAKPGYRTQRIRYHELCPTGDCDRGFDFDLVLEPD